MKDVSIGNEATAQESTAATRLWFVIAASGQRAAGPTDDMRKGTASGVSRL